MFTIEGRSFEVVRNHSRWSVLEIKGDARTPVYGAIRQKVLALFNAAR